jgi:extradiol dioxygenase family protein
MGIEDLEDEMDNWTNVSYRIQNEGVDYCFKHYSRFEEIKDEEFHTLRLELISKMKLMDEMVKNKIEDLATKIEKWYEENNDI